MRLRRGELKPGHKVEIVDKILVVMVLLKKKPPEVVTMLVGSGRRAAAAGTSRVPGKLLRLLL